MHITLRQLEVFAEVLKSGSTTQASQMLALSQSAVSAALTADCDSASICEAWVVDPLFRTSAKTSSCRSVICMIFPAFIDDPASAAKAYAHHAQTAKPLVYHLFRLIINI